MCDADPRWYDGEWHLHPAAPPARKEAEPARKTEIFDITEKQFIRLKNSPAIIDKVFVEIPAKGPKLYEVGFVCRPEELVLVGVSLGQPLRHCKFSVRKAGGDPPEMDRRYRARLGL